MPESPAIARLLLGLLVACTAGWLWDIGEHSLWVDELITKRSIESWQRALVQGFHPPGHYLVLRLWSEVFGASKVAIRSLSVLFSVGTVWLCFGIAARIWRDERSALIFASLVALNPAAVYFAREARMYAMWMFFTTLTIYVAVGLAGRRQVDRRDIVPYTAGIIGAQLSYHYAVFYSAAICMGTLFLLGSRPWPLDRERWRQWWRLNAPILLAAPCVLLFLILMRPEAQTIAKNLRHDGRKAAGSPLLLEPYRLVWLLDFTAWPYQRRLPWHDLAGVLNLVIQIAILAWLELKARIDRRHVLLLGLLLLLPYLAIDLLPIRDYTRTQFVSVLPLLCISSAPLLALTRAGRRWARILGFAVLLAVAAWWAPLIAKIYNDELEPWEALCERIARDTRAAEFKVFVSRPGASRGIRMCEEGPFQVGGFHREHEIVDELMGYDEVWIVYSHYWGLDQQTYAQTRAREQIIRNYEVLDSQQLSGLLEYAHLRRLHDGRNLSQ